MTEFDSWPGGNTWVYHANITNDGANSGDHTYTVVPGALNEALLMYGLLDNDDTSNRTGFVRITDGTVIVGNLLFSQTLNSGTSHGFPTTSAAAATGNGVDPAHPLMLSGTMELVATVSAIAVSQDTAFGIVMRIRGPAPTVTLTSPTSAVEVVDVDAVF